MDDKEIGNTAVGYAWKRLDPSKICYPNARLKSSLELQDSARCRSPRWQILCRDPMVGDFCRFIHGPHGETRGQTG